jgi:hypothetical protein
VSSELVGGHVDLSRNAPALAPHVNRNRLTRITIQMIVPLLASGVAFDPVKLADMLCDACERIVSARARAVDILDELDRAGVVITCRMSVFMRYWFFCACSHILFRRLLDRARLFRSRRGAATTPLF